MKKCTFTTIVTDATWNMITFQDKFPVPIMDLKGQTIRIDIKVVKDGV
jgi:hypothetical protein